MDLTVFEPNQRKVHYFERSDNKQGMLC